MSNFISQILKTFFSASPTSDVCRQNENRLEAFLRAVPFEYCGWNDTGLQAISSEFSILFDLYRVRGIDDILECLQDTDAKSVSRHYQNLVEHATSFDLKVSVTTTDKILHIFGQRGTLADNLETFNVLWAIDITESEKDNDNTALQLAALKTREAGFLSTLNALPIPIWVTDKDLNMTWFNPKYLQIVKQDFKTALEEQTEINLTAEGDTPLNLKLLAKRATAQNTPQTQTGHLGDQQIEIVVSPLENGQTVSCSFNITRLNVAREDIKQQQRANESFLNQLTTAVAWFNKDGYLTYHNPAYADFWELDDAFLTSEPRITDIIDKLRTERKITEQANFKKYKDSWLQDAKTLAKSKSKTIHLPDGRIAQRSVMARDEGGFIITLEDVTSNMELKSSYKTLMAVRQETLENIGEGIAVIGEDGYIKLSNKRFLNLWSYTDTQDIIGLHVNEFFDKISIQFKNTEQNDKKSLIQACFAREDTLTRLSLGTDIHYEYSTVSLPDGNLLLTVKDITDTTMVENALIEKNAALEAAEKLKTDFLANVSYQLRTPLNAMMGFSEILNEQYFGPLNERQKTYTENTIRAGQRLMTLIDNILDLSTVEAGFLALNLSNFKVKDAIEDITVLTEDWARREGIEIKTKIAKTIGKLTADERRFKQVLLHLIRNAIDYTPSGGQITVTAKRLKNNIKITILDTGIGIPEKDLNRIFNAFEKSQINVKRQKEELKRENTRHSGAGLGLSLVQHIINLHGGEIDIKSVEEKGTEISYTFPLSANENV